MAEQCTVASNGTEGMPSPEVLELWKDVSGGLEKHKSVAWAKAVDSLQHAHRYLQTSVEARTFVDRTMGQIIPDLLQQYQGIIDSKEKESFDKSLHGLLDIIINDLEEASCNIGAGEEDVESNKVGVSGTLDALICVFDSNNTGLICRFRSMQGFTKLASYMEARVSSPNFPDMDMVTSILRVVRETIPSPISEFNRGHERGESSDSDGIRDIATEISRSIETHVLSLDETSLVQIGENMIKLLRWRMFRLYLRLSSSDPTLMSSLFIFWRRLALKLVRSHNHPLQVLGWEKINILIKDSKNLYVDVPRSYIVSGAGSKFVNGRYDIDPRGMVMENGQLKPSVDPLYHRVHNETNTGRGEKTLTLFKCQMRSSGEKWWFVSEADRNQPGTERDIDYYYHKSKTNEAKLPPASGWLTMEATDPPPKLEPIGLKIVDNDPHVLEHQLAEWAMENRLIELIFAEPINSSIVSGSKELVKFLSKRICAQFESSGRNLLQMQSETMVLDKFFLKAWKICSESTDVELQAQIYHMLVSVVPTLSDELTISLFQSIRDSLVMSTKCENDFVSGFCRNIDVLTDINVDNMALVDLARQIKMMVS